MTEAELDRYAEAILGGCVLLRPGDLLLIDGEPAHRPLAVALATAAFRRGASNVEVSYSDPLVRRARAEHAHELASLGRLEPWQIARYRGAIGPDRIVVRIIGDEIPDLLADLPPERAGTEASGNRRQLGFFTRAIGQWRVRWTGVTFPTPLWAQRVYPELAPADAERALARDLLRFCRIERAGDGVEVVRRRCDELLERAASLTARSFRRLELRAPGTELEIGLPADARFLAAAAENAYGERLLVNYPSEEVFTSPTPGVAEGTFRLTRPIALPGLGVTVTDVSGELRGGRLVRIDAPDAGAREAFARYLDIDAAARRLGEIALVDRHSPVGRAGRIYHNTLIDENAATHMAFGSGFPVARRPGGRRSPVNRSRSHVDVMLGSDELVVAGVAADGTRTPILEAGSWVLPA
jgi:aminopeptidase